MNNKRGFKGGLGMLDFNPQNNPNTQIHRVNLQL